MYVGKPPVRDDGPDVVVTPVVKAKTVRPAIPPVTYITPSQHGGHHGAITPPDIYPQQPDDVPSHAGHSVVTITNAGIVDAGHVVKPVVTSGASPIVVDAITAAGGPTPIQDIGPSILPTPVVNTATGEVVGTVTLDQKTGTPVVTPITGDVVTADTLFTPQPTDWKPVLYAGAAVIGLMLLFGGKKGKK